MINEIIHGDCLQVMEQIPDKSIDLVIADPPFGISGCKWDQIVDFSMFWNQIERIVKDNAAICIFGSQPFTSQLILSNLKLFKYEIIWQKDKGSNPLFANKGILKAHENICVFYKKLPVYNPQWTYSTPYVKKQGKCTFGEVVNDGPKPADKYCEDGRRFPISVVKFSRDMNRDKANNHPTAKPVKLLEYLIKTFSNEDALILDPFMGGGSTAIAAINTSRRFIGIEKEEKYVEIARNRISMLQCE